MNSRKNIEVLPFTEDNLAIALSNQFISAEQVPIVKKSHFNYLKSYLSDLGAQTILIEYPYISKAYLNDFASYYSLCFQTYSKYSKRIHFFDKKFTIRAVNSALFNSKSPSNKILSEKHYLGNIVAKPLPEAIIGSTLLKTYSDDDERVYTTKKYHVNLFGKKITFKSLVYQEQDTVVSACATSAIWTAFHKAAKQFQTSIPTPNEITTSAGNLFFTSGRTFPNHGLDGHQIGNAIHSIGLVSELRNGHSEVITRKNLFKAFIYAYLKLELPILLGIRIDNIGLHLITVTGFKKPTQQITGTTDDPALTAFGLDKIYGHDDQTGPFARMEIVDAGANKFKLKTSWEDDKGDCIEAEIVSISVPVHKKIRINFDNIYAQTKKINWLFSFLLDESLLTWDVYLEFGNNYKQTQRDSSIEKAFKEKILLQPYPKHIWVTSLIFNGVKIMDFIYDATGIERSFYCIAINLFNSAQRTTLQTLYGLPHFRNAVELYLDKNYLNLFDDSVK